MKKCTSFLIITNELKDVDLKWSKYTRDIILSKGCKASLHIGLDDDGLQDEALDSDVAIVMGGDGTMLRVAHLLEGKDIPVIGVNLGTVGFLTEVVTGEIEDMINRLIYGDYTIENRMMLTGKVYRGEDTAVLQALNDVVLARRNSLRLIAVRIYVNGQLFDTCEADGILLATPTGSTGYNLSAGGPIVKPDARLIVMTPVSPYSLSRRSVVFGEDDKITLELLEKRKDAPSSGLVSFDGADNLEMSVGDKVEISASPNTLALVKLEDASVYDILRKKLGG